MSWSRWSGGRSRASVKVAKWLYVSLGVPEFWRFNGRVWQIWQLVDGAYVVCDRSPTFLMMEKPDLYQFLAAALVDEVAAEISLRQEVQQRLPA